MTNPATLHRLSSVDVVRGLVMILMALDHTRDFFTVPSLIDPTNLARTTTNAQWIFESPNLGAYPFLHPPGWGFSLPVIYSIWIGVVVGLYPLCWWMAAVKARRRHWWLSYV